MPLLWDLSIYQRPHNAQTADCVLGRYIVQRRNPREHAFIAKFNGAPISTTISKTMDAAKALCEQHYEANR